MMKCLCGFESEEIDDIISNDKWIELQDISFRDWDVANQYACPKCGTIKIEVY